MRLFFGIMLALSILLFVAIQWGGVLTGAGKVSQANGEMYPEKIILLDVPQITNHVATSPLPLVTPVSAPQAVSAVPAMPVTPKAVPAASHEVQATQPKEMTVPVKPRVEETSAKPSAQVKVAEPAKPDALVCIDWGEFAGTDLAKAEKSLADLKLGDRLSRRTVEYETGYWVYLEPLKSKAALNKKVAELKKLGITEYFVLREARKWHNAISFGIFKSKDSAKQLQAELKKKGLHTFVGERKSKLKYIVFGMNGVTNQEYGKLTKMQKEFSNSELKKTVCH